MAAKRGKKQARRSGESSVPGYVWLLVGLLIGGAIAAALYMKMPHAIDNLLPHPNPAAHPATASEPGVAPEGSVATPVPAGPKKTEFDFYKVLPEKEVIIPDEELSARVKAEAAANLASKQQATPAVVPGAPAGTSPDAANPNVSNPNVAVPTAATPKTPTPPVASANPATPTDTTAAPTTLAVAPTANTPKTGQYLLQAGAFRNDKQADDLKARIAMLGLVGRVEIVQTPAGEMHRVRLGPYATASELEQAKQKLSSGGMPAVAIRVK